MSSSNNNSKPSNKAPPPSSNKKKTTKQPQEEPPASPSGYSSLRPADVSSPAGDQKHPSRQQQSLSTSTVQTATVQSFPPIVSVATSSSSSAGQQKPTKSKKIQKPSKGVGRNSGNSKIDYVQQQQQSGNLSNYSGQSSSNSGSTSTILRSSPTTTTLHRSNLSLSHRQLLKKIKSNTTCETFTQYIKYRAFGDIEANEIEVEMHRTIVNNIQDISTTMNRRAQCK